MVSRWLSHSRPLTLVSPYHLRSWRIEQVKSDYAKSCAHFDRAIAILKNSETFAEELKTTLFSDTLTGLAGSMLEQGNAAAAATKELEAIL